MRYGVFQDRAQCATESRNVNTPDFSAILRNIGEQRREDSDRAVASLRSQAADVARAAAWALPDAKAATCFAVRAIADIGQVFEADAVILLAALHRAIAAHSTHIEPRRETLACLANATSEMLGEAKRDEEEREPPEYDDPRDWEPGELA